VTTLPVRDDHSKATGSSRERLLEAAIDSIERDGEAGVRVEQIAHQANVTKASMYHFFQDRDGLVVAAQAERYRRSLRYGMDEQVAAVRRCGTRDDFEQLVRDWMVDTFSADGIARRRIRVDVLGSSVSRPGLQAQLAHTDRQVAHELAGLLLIAHDRGWIDMPFDLEACSMWWLSMLNGRYLLEHQDDPERLAGWDAVATEATIRIVFGSR